MLMKDTERKVAFITGGASGIGRTLSLTFAKSGYDVAFSYFGSEQGAKEVASLIESYGKKALPIKANLGNFGDIIKMFEEFKKHFNKLDVFINNAGITEKSPFLETTEEQFDKMCDVDFKGAYFCSQNAAKIMIEENIEGNIIMISSNNAYAHFADVSVYGSVKAAMTKMAEHMAIELAKYKIRVNTIAPGWTDTGAARLGNKEETYYKIPLCKWVDSAEIAETALYLSSPAAKSVTGATIVMDNGALLVSDKRERYGY